MDDGGMDTLSTVFFWSYFLILIAGTTMTLIFLLALVRGRKILAQWPFYKIVWSMTWMDAIYLAVQLCWQFPVMAADDDGPPHSNITIEESKLWYNQPFVQFILSVLNFIPPKVFEMIFKIHLETQGILYFSLLMALNRLAVFVESPVTPIFSKLHGLFRDYVGLTTIACWLLIIILSIYTELLSPTYNFNRTTLKYVLTAPAIIDSNVLLQINTYSDYIVPFVVVVIYIAVYLIISKTRRQFVGSTSSSGSFSTTRSRPPDDRKLLFQAIVITFFLQAKIIFFNSNWDKFQLDNVTRVINVVYDGNDWFEYFINILDLITTVINHSVHATIFLLYNSTIRSFLPRPSMAELQRRLHC